MYISLSDFFVLSALAAVAAYWWDSVRKKEIASDYGRRMCVKAQVQFLDDTVRLSRLRLRRDAAGRIGLLRSYQFEYSYDGVTRLTAQLELLNTRLFTKPEFIQVISGENIAELQGHSSDK